MFSVQVSFEASTRPMPRASPSVPGRSAIEITRVLACHRVSNPPFVRPL